MYAGFGDQCVKPLRHPSIFANPIPHHGEEEFYDLALLFELEDGSAECL